MRTLLDRDDRHERRTAIIAHELARYNIDIAAPSETRISLRKSVLATPF